MPHRRDIRRTASRRRWTGPDWRDRRPSRAYECHNRRVGPLGRVQFEQGVCVMATEQEMNELLGRMITDGEFRSRMMEDPKAAVEEAGYDLTSEQLSQLETPEMGELVGAVDDRVSKFVIPVMPGLSQISKELTFTRINTGGIIGKAM
jgi:hypothetical protein